MRQLFTNRLNLMEDGLKTGIGLGLGYIFLTLIGIPSSDSEQLAALTLPIFLLMAFGFGWSIAKSDLETVLANSIALGSGAAIILLVFMGQMNQWHTNDVDVTGEYFARMDTYPVQVMSGVPTDELFPAPEIDPLTGEYPPDAEFRTNPMTLYLGHDVYHVVSWFGLNIGGLYGFGLLILLASVFGGVGNYGWRQIDWATVRETVATEDRRQLVSTLTHWTILSLPLIFFALFWLTIPQTFNGDTDDAEAVINLQEILNLTSDSLIDEASLQLGIAFLIIIGILFSTRRAHHAPSAFGYVMRTSFTGGLVIAMAGLSLLRISNHDVVVVSPSIGFLPDADMLTSVITILLFAGLLAYTVFANEDEQNFQYVYVTVLAIGFMFMSPLYMNQYHSFTMGRVALSVMVGFGLNIVVGQAGLLDLGYVAFYAVGAYAFALLAIESDRSLSVVNVDYLNQVGWSIVAAMIIAPIVMFVGTNLWRNANPTPPPDNVHIKQQSRVWAGAPPWYISLGMIALVVVLVFVGRSILEEATDVGQFSSFLIVIVVAFIAAAIVGFILGVPVLRLRGDYLAIVTLGFGEIISLALKNLDGLTGGPSGAIGIPKPVPDGTPLPTTNLIMLYLSFIGAALVMMMSLRLRDSRIGRAWYALKSDEDIAQAMGINLVNVKLLAFSIGAALAGLAGMLFASRQNAIFPEDFGLEVSINVLALVIIGGMGSIPGVIIGAIALIGLPELLRPVADYRIMAFGLLLIITTVVLPKGLLPVPPPELEDKARELAEKKGKSNE